MPLGYCVAVKKSFTNLFRRRIIDRRTLSNYMAVVVPRYTEHGTRRALTLALCRRRTVSRFFVPCALQGNSFSHILRKWWNLMRFVSA